METSVKEAVQESKEDSEEIKVLGTKLLEVSNQVQTFVKETKDAFDATNGYVSQMKGYINRMSDESKQTTELLRQVLLEMDKMESLSKIAKPSNNNKTKRIENLTTNDYQKDERPNQMY